MEEPAKPRLAHRAGRGAVATVAAVAAVAAGIVLFYVRATLGFHGLIPKGAVNAVNLGLPWAGAAIRGS